MSDISPVFFWSQMMGATTQNDIWILNILDGSYWFTLLIYAYVFFFRRLFLLAFIKKGMINESPGNPQDANQTAIFHGFSVGFCDMCHDFTSYKPSCSSWFFSTISHDFPISLHIFPYFPMIFPYFPMIFPYFPMIFPYFPMIFHIFQ